MKHNNKEIKISFWASHFTTIVSVTLVLILGGIIASIWISARAETRRLQEQLEFNVILKDSVSNAEGQALASEIGRQPYAGTVDFVSREKAMELWVRDTGENLEELFGVNPLSPEISFTLKSGYASKESMQQIKHTLEGNAMVESVATPDDQMVAAMNENITKLTVILGIVAAIMILISLVLITNTVHLAIYSRRFTIHTMQLVGATDGFIRRPVVGSNLLCGLIAGLLATAIMALALWGAKESGIADVGEYLSWADFGLVSAGMIATGIIMCAAAAWIAASHYLHKDYDELFK